MDFSTSPVSVLHNLAVVGLLDGGGINEGMREGRKEEFWRRGDGEGVGRKGSEMVSSTPS